MRTQRTLYMVRRRRRRGFIRVVGMLLMVVDVVLLLLVVDQVIVPLQVSFFGSSLVILCGHPVLGHLPLVLCSPVLEPNFHLKKEKVFRKRVNFGWNMERH